MRRDLRVETKAKESESKSRREGKSEKEGWTEVPARAGAGDKQLHGFHGSTRRAKSALISGSRACRKRGEARRTRGVGQRRLKEERKEWKVKTEWEEESVWCARRRWVEEGKREGSVQDSGPFEYIGGGQWAMLHLPPRVSVIAARCHATVHVRAKFVMRARLFFFFGSARLGSGVASRANAPRRMDD